MNPSQNFSTQAKELIDDLKSVCANNGLGNDGNEFKIITQIFLYKFLNDKFAYQAKQIEPSLAKAEHWEEALAALPAGKYKMLMAQLGADTAKLKPEHLISTLYNRQQEENFANILDDTLIDIAALNAEIFSVVTDDKEKIVLFERITNYVASKRDDFARALINKLVNFSFESIFAEKFDFYATLFEYLIKDYNKDGGGKYAEYYTPHAVAKIMASCLVPDASSKNVQDVSCYDPSAGSGTLLMNLAHAIGEDRCSIYSQDISQKSSSLLRLNLILNNLVHSIPNIIQGNTILNPEHREVDGGQELKKFDYIVSNPPFKLDFSDYSKSLDTKANKDRFFAGIPNIPKTKMDSMAIYQLFLQHIIHSLKDNGKAAIVVPTGFITSGGIDRKIREYLVEKKILAGVISMPSNIFATTSTSVSILFLDASNKETVTLIDASKLGTKVKDGKNKKTVLSSEEEQRIITTFNNRQAIDDFSVTVSYDEIIENNHSLSAGQYFEIKIQYLDISEKEFKNKVAGFENCLVGYFEESKALETKIQQNLNRLKYE
ncbi:MAG: type I restriction enzyme M protein [Rubritalea sp.]|jgi:type I restriction enzyme M protein